MQLELSCGLKFPFLHRAIQILQSTVPEGHLTPHGELIFVLRAFGKAVAGQNFGIESVVFNTDSSKFVALLDRGDSQASLDQMGRKKAGITQFNLWLREHSYQIVVQANTEYC
jgi:hypothetical protein